MKKLFCLLAAAALFTGCAGTNNEPERGSTGTSVDTAEGTSTETSTSGSVTNGTNSSGLRTNSPAQTPDSSSPQRPTQTPRGN